MSASATFGTADSTTKGSWIGNYGDDGAAVPSDTPTPGVSLPAYVTGFTAPGSGNQYIWYDHTAAATALERPGGPDGYLSIWYQSADPLVISFSVTSPCRVALYFWDDGTDRVESVSVINDDTDATLDTQAVPAPFTNGVWMPWDLTVGNYRFEISRTVGSNTAVAGFFFDEGGEAPAASPNAAPLLCSF